KPFGGTMNQALRTLLSLFAFWAMHSSQAMEGRVEVYLTTPDGKHLLESQKSLVATPRRSGGLNAGGGAVIEVDPSRRYQTMEGFGTAMTESSAYLLTSLEPKLRREVMEKVFSPTRGIGMSALR